MTQVYGRYRRDRAGWFFGLTGPQIAGILAGGTPALVAVATGAWAALGIWAPVWAVATAGVVIPVHGFSAAGWVAVATAHAWAKATGWGRFTSKAAAGAVTDPAEADLPGALSGIEVHDGPIYGTTMTRVALIHDTTTQTWAATAAVDHPGLGLAEPETRDRMAAGLAELCETASRTEMIHHVAMCVRTVPDDGAERTDWVRRHRRNNAPDLARAVNDEVTAALAAASVRTETYCTVVVDQDRITHAGGHRHDPTAVVYSLLAEVEAMLVGPIGATTVTWLDSPALAKAIRTGFEPGDTAALAAADLAAAQNPTVAAGVPIAAAGPTRAEADLRCYRHGDWTSLTDTLILPTSGARLGALAPALAPSVAGERRALTVYYAPLTARAGNRLTGREELSAQTAAELRRRVGRLERAADRRARNQVSTTDEALAAGRCLVRIAAAVAVTVPSSWAAAEAGRRLDAAIRAAGFTPQRLDGATSAAFCAAVIPLGIGLPGHATR